jgi:hypothetical protein
VAIYHFSAKVVQRSSGRSAVAAAAYRAGELLVNERTGYIADFRQKRGIVHAQVFLPGGATMDRQELWNRVERKHTRGDAVTAREFEVALPHELNDQQRLELAQAYAQELADQYNVAVDVALHEPDDGGLNKHGHFLVSACHVDAQGVCGKKAVELDPIHCDRHKIENVVEVTRRRWQDMCNAALEQAGHDARIDHRTLAAQGIDRPATVHRGPAISQMLKDGRTSGVHARVQAQLDEMYSRLVADAAIAKAAESAAAEIPGIERELKALYQLLEVANGNRAEQSGSIVVDRTREHDSRGGGAGSGRPGGPGAGRNAGGGAGGGGRFAGLLGHAAGAGFDFGAKFGSDDLGAGRPGRARTLADALAKPGFGPLGGLGQARSLNDVLKLRSRGLDEGGRPAPGVLPSDAPGQLGSGDALESRGLRRAGDGQDDGSQVEETPAQPAAPAEIKIGGLSLADLKAKLKADLEGAHAAGGKPADKARQLEWAAEKALDTVEQVWKDLLDAPTQEAIDQAEKQAGELAWKLKQLQSAPRHEIDAEAIRRMIEALISTLKLLAMKIAAMLGYQLELQVGVSASREAQIEELTDKLDQSRQVARSKSQDALEKRIMGLGEKIANVKIEAKKLRAQMRRPLSKDEALQAQKAAEQKVAKVAAESNAKQKALDKAQHRLGMNARAKAELPGMIGNLKKLRTQIVNVTTERNDTSAMRFMRRAELDKQLQVLNGKHKELAGNVKVAQQWAALDVREIHEKLPELRQAAVEASAQHQKALAALDAAKRETAAAVERHRVQSAQAHKDSLNHRSTMAEVDTEAPEPARPADLP